MQFTKKLYLSVSTITAIALFSTQILGGFNTLHIHALNKNTYEQPVAFELTPAENDLLQSKRAFTVGYSSDIDAVYSNRSGIDSTGLAIDILDDIANIMGANFKFIAINGFTDISTIDFNISVSEQADVNGYNRSDPYANLTYVLISNPNATAATNNVGVLSFDGWFPEQRNPNFLYYSNIYDLESALATGKVSSAVTLGIYSSFLFQKDYLTGYHASTTDYILPMQIEVTDDLVDYIPIINKAIAALDNTQVDTLILNNITSFNKQDSFMENLMAVPEVFQREIIVVSGFMVLAYCLYLFNKRRTYITLLNTDIITGLPSLHYFIQLAEKKLSKDKQNRVILTFDIDNFQYINEIAGYEKGTQMLKSLTDEVSKFLPYDAIFCREKADVFVIFATMDEHFLSLVNGIKKIPTTLLSHGYPECLISISMGSYYIKENNQSMDIMINYAHSARHISKPFFGSTLTNFTAEMEESRNIKNIIVAKMNEALDNQEFKLVLQPKVSLHTSSICGAEALVRWIRDDGTMFFPDMFIPTFEANAFIIKLDFYMLRKCCSLVAQHKDEYDIPIISVNLSGVTIQQDDIVNTLTNIVDDYKIDHKYIEFEITEGAFVNRFEFIIEAVDSLKNNGFKVSMDDFGSGLSSINRLKQINVDYLKIDKTFLSEQMDANATAIVDSVISMSHKLNLTTVAEGAETIEHVTLLKELGCDIIQGYYFYKPLQPDAFLDAIKNDEIKI